MAMRPDVSYTPSAKFLREQTGDIITFKQFEEGIILTKTRKTKKAVTNSTTIQ